MITPQAQALAERVRVFIGRAQTTEREFNELALAVFAYQFEAVPVYHKLCERRGLTPPRIQDWREIPVLPVSSFKEFTVSSVPEGERTRVFHSSGTTGQTPSRHHHSAASLELYEASLRPWFARHFASARGTRFICLTPPPAATPHSSLIHMLELVAREWGAADSFFGAELAADGSWSLRLDQIMEALRGIKPVTLLGTAFSFVHLLDYLAEKQLRLALSTGSSVMETGGYKGRSRVVPKTELRRLLTRHLGIPSQNIVTEYGMSELSSQAYDGVAGERASNIFHFPPWARVQIVSPETGLEVNEGETGLLRIFDLANVFSAMALQTEDLAVRVKDGFELIGRAELSESRGCSLMASA